MKTFDVLDPEVDVDRSRLLEASAGTGKTYTIEHLYTRLLKERKPSTDVSRILVVTFTKAATRELRMRIRKSLESEALKRALLSFDEAKIFTLHGFCYETLRTFPLEADLALSEEEEGDLSEEEKLQVVKDLYRTGLTDFSAGQRSALLHWAGGDTDVLAKAILREVERGGEIVTTRPLEKIFGEVSVGAIPSSEELLEIAQCYRGVCNRQGELKPEVVEDLKAFTQGLSNLTLSTFDGWIQKGNLFLEKVVFGELRAKQERGPWEGRFEKLATLFQEAKNPLNILGRVAKRVKEMLEARLSQRERLTFDGILEAMEKATRRPSFCERVQAAFDVAIVDEFQDTDPLQWTILQRLFGKKTLILVGDPKQSIYAFRNADIYSYLEALDALGEEARFSLGTNYRSRPGLVKLLNGLFSSELIHDPIPLPEREGAITCPPVKAGLAEDHPLSREGAVQFFVTQGKSTPIARFPSEAMEGEFLLFIGQEIQALAQTYDLPYSHFAVLVHDRYQAQRVCAHLKMWGIKALSVRGQNPSEFSLFWPLYHVLRAARDPNDQVAVRTALSSPLIGLLPEQWDAKAYLAITRLHTVLVTQGFFPFFEALMNTEWDGETTYKRAGDGVDFLYQLALRITESGEDDLPHLFHHMAESRDERFTLRDQETDGVQVLTTFASKGLEYGVVFALSLATRSGGKRRGLIPYRRDGKTYLSGEGGSEEEQTVMAEEGDAEKMRLLYVALTRAKDRVYVPVAIDAGKAPRFGNASPIELYLAKLGPNQDPLYNTLPIANVKRLDIVKSVGAVVREVETGITPVKLRDCKKPSASSKPPRQPVVKPKRIQSFSGLAQGTHIPLAVEVGEGKNAQSLPAGPETGILIHELLEKIDPQTPFDALIPVVTSIAKGRLADWEEVLSQMVWAAFHRSPIKGVPLSKMVREMDLLYSITESMPTELTPGLITGILDLFFEDQGKFYLLDWKSNRLPSYDQETLMQEMAAHDYVFQAKLYAEAANRYLTKLGKLPISGVYYVFLRGLSDDQGVLLLNPEELKWE